MFSISRKQVTLIEEKVSPVLDYILAHVGEGECPYVKVNILGQDFFGLLDSGANKTFVGESGWKILQSLGVKLDLDKRVACTVATNDSCECIGVITVPVRLRDLVKVMKIYVVPQLRHSLILGIDFWVNMGIVPDMRRGEWHFSTQDLPLPMVNSIECDLDGDQRSRLESVVDEYFARVGDKKGCTTLVKHKIVTSSPPIKQRYYPVSPFKQKLIDEELDKMLQQGVVEPSKSAWSSPVLLVPKKDGTQRFCVDFRKLNAVTERDAYPLPYINSILSKLSSAKYLTSLDIESAFWQVALEDDSKQYTAFTVPGRGLYQFTRLPFGLHNSPATFQRLIDTILGPELEPYVFCYLDDIIVIAPDFDKHVEILTEVFKRLSEAGLTLNRGKCLICRPELKYLGYIVNRSGLHVDPDKVDCITNMAAPKTVTEVRRLIGMVSWYRRFIPTFSDLVVPLTSLLKKGAKFIWDDGCEESFKNIKNALVSAPILTCPNFEYPFVLQTDASAYALGSVLTQKIDGEEHVICYLSRTLSKQERKYSAVERELLCVLWSIEKLRCYLEGAKFSVVTDCYSLQWLDNLQNPQGRLGRWALRLQQFDYTVIHRKGKDNVVPDALSRPVVDESIEVDCIELGEIHDKWYVSMLKRVEKNPLKFPKWRILHNKLYKYTELDFPELRRNEDFWKLVVPKGKRKAVIRAAHDVETSGHLGIYKTFGRVARLYYWPQMKSDISKYVKSCEVCQKAKPEQKLPAGLMGKKVVADRCWQVISMDLFGPLPKSKQGNMYIFVVTDNFSKFNLFFPIRRALAHTVVKLVEEQVFLVYGVPQLIRCDNGVQFKGRIFANLTRKYGVHVLFNPNYHPAPNATERYNRVLKTMISCYIRDSQREWDVNLSALGCALRTARHEVTSQTPYFINFGKEMCLHGSEYQQNNIAIEDHQPTLDDKVAALHKMRGFVARRINEAYRRSRNQYNLRRRDVHYDVGDLVLKRKHVLSDAGNYFTAKLAGKFEGPYRVRKKFGYCVYLLEDLSGRVCKGTWHVKDLKPYIDPGGEVELD